MEPFQRWALPWVSSAAGQRGVPSGRDLERSARMVTAVIPVSCSISFAV
ncbi:hypothetical protein ACFW5P_28370 [Streptomyces rochei]